MFLRAEYSWDSAHLAIRVTSEITTVIDFPSTLSGKSINHLNAFFTGHLSPVFLFNGTFFPASNLLKSLQIRAQILPLTQSVAVMATGWNSAFLLHLLFMQGWLESSSSR